MLLLPVILSIDDVAVSSTLTRLIWKDWAPRKEAIPELLIGIEQLLESTDFSVSEEPILKTFTTLYGITDFFAFLLFNLLVKGQYDRFEKMLVTYAVLPLVADESVSCPSSLASLRHVLGLSDELLYTEYIHMTTGLVSLAALALFSQVGADVLSLLGLDEASRNYSALDGSVSLLRKILDMMAALLDHFTTTHSYIATTISILRSVCVFAKSDDDPAEFLQELATRLSSVNGLATVWQSAPLSLVCTCLNTYSKAAAEQLHKSLTFFAQVHLSTCFPSLRMGTPLDGLHIYLMNCAFAPLETRLSTCLVCRMQGQMEIRLSVTSAQAVCLP